MTARRSTALTTREKIVFTLLFCGGGLALVAVSLPRVLHGMASLDWRSTTATVVESRIETAGANGAYHPRVRYRYRVGGREYENDELGFDQLYIAGNRIAAQEVLTGLEIGRSVSVYYDPSDPRRSTLAQGWTWKSWFLPGLGALLCALGPLVWFAKETRPR